MVPPERHRPDLPDVLRTILARALAKDRDQRYPDCHAFREDLEQFIRSEGKPVTRRQVAQFVQQITASDAPAPDGLEAQARPRLGRRWILAAAVGLVVVLGGGALLWKMIAAPEPEKVRVTPP
ncbi:hypothetical protein HMI49_41325 [Corallococcus exercitus]|uniref:Serine/threonine protein kinase n=1 Tax=Corallococcus exercitus TaxID=2316736 RepID=A0A7Y4KTF9_9BACT|nr:hypothetical protein [Corallococcus exercitus]NOK39625.1 hypothetical protein [Corallococcus exercitus]